MNFLSFAVLFRALFENVLLARQYLSTRLLPTVEACAKEGQVRAEQLEHLIIELDTSVRRSKVDWDKILAGSFDGIAEQDEMVWDKVSLKKAAGDWERFSCKLGALTPTNLYAVLCDLAHPNLGSALVCMRQDEFAFAVHGQKPLGLILFAALFPSLKAITAEFQRIQSQLLLLRFDQPLNE